jgi:hypothetical protein
MRHRRHGTAKQLAWRATEWSAVMVGLAWLLIWSWVDEKRHRRGDTKPGPRWPRVVRRATVRRLFARV